MVTRGQVGPFNPKLFPDFVSYSVTPLLHALLTTAEPKSFKSAIKQPAWLAAMIEEIAALRQNNTWLLVPRPVNTNIVGSKWIFRTKYLSDGSVERFKAHLVA